MPLTVVESDAFPTTLTVPAANEAASAPSLVSQFLQGVSNRTRWLYNRTKVFVDGGTLTTVGDLILNGLTLPAAGGLAIVGALTSTGSAIFASLNTPSTGDVSSGRDLAAARDLVVSRNGQVGGNFVVLGAMTVAAGGRFARPCITVTTSVAFTPVLGTDYYIIAGAAFVIQLPAGGIVGETMEFRVQGSFVVGIKDSGGTLRSQIVGANSGAGVINYVRFRWIGTDWIVWDEPQRGV